MPGLKQGVAVQANGLLSRDGNPHTLTGALVEFPSFSDTLNDVRTSNDTRVTIDNNAAAISALAGLNEASGSWDQCLQVGVYVEIVLRGCQLAAPGRQGVIFRLPAAWGSLGPECAAVHQQ